MKPGIQIFITLLFAVHFAFANDIDSTRGQYSVSFRGDYGFLIAHRPALIPLQQKHIPGFEISIAKISAGSKEWERDFLNPSRGLTIAFFDLGSREKLGNGIAVYPYIDFPLSGKKDDRFILRYGIGLGWVEKIFNPDDNFKNAAIGNHLNGVIHFDLHYEKYISECSTLELGIGVTHYSNGSFTIPNLGINLATMNLAYTRVFGNKLQIDRTPISIKPRSHWWTVYLAGGLKEIYPPEGEKYQVGVFSVSRMQTIRNKSNWGINLENFYDNSLTKKLEYNEEELKGFMDNVRIGLSGTYELKVGQTGLQFGMGFYLYSRWKEDGNVYHKICLRQYFKNVFLCLNLKTHYARADFVEFGIGTTFAKSK